MSYQGQERRRSGSDDVEGLVQRVVREGVPVDEIELRKTDTAKADELRAAVKDKLFSFAGYTTKKAAAELSPITPGKSSADGEKEAQPSRLLSFAELESFLKEHGIDLGKAREEDVRSMVRWGALTIEDSDKYGRAFEENFEPVSEADLKELVRQLEKEPALEQRVILGVDSLRPDQGFQKLIVEAGIPYRIKRRFSKYQRIDAKTKKPLQNQRPSGKAGILFTPNHLNLPYNLRAISANYQLAEMAKGRKYVGPVGWMKLFRQFLDKALPFLYPDEVANIDNFTSDQYKELVKKAILDLRIDTYLPDVKTGTQFPDLRYQDDGAVPDLHFYPYTDRKVLLDYNYPGSPDINLGGRAALGTFLS